MAPKSKKRIQLVIEKEIDELLSQLAEKERRTRSAIVELSILAYAKKSQSGEKN